MHRHPDRHSVTLTAHKGAESRQIEIPVESLVMAGWTGRSAADIEAHIKELDLLGIRAPKEMPVFYRVASSLLTTASWVQVIGEDSTGEVEFVLFNGGDETWVGLGSDHTDRKAEVLGITLSKQLCAKPAGCNVWALSDLESHWDELILRAYTEKDRGRQLYQEAGVSALRHPRNLIELYRERNPNGFASGTVIFSGTFSAREAYGFADWFSMELEDPVLQRRITHAYRIRSLPIPYGPKNQSSPLSAYRSVE